MAYYGVDEMTFSLALFFLVGFLMFDRDKGEALRFGQKMLEGEESFVCLVSCFWLLGHSDLCK
jgi:hypothetical protein